MILIIIVIILGLYFHFEPSLDRLKTGEVVLWYNSDRHRKIRKYIKLNKK